MASADRVDKQFIITLAVAAGAIAVTLLNWTSQTVGYAFLVLTALLLLYAAIYSRLGDQNPLKKLTHEAVTRWWAYAITLIMFAAVFALLLWRINEAEAVGFMKGWPDAIECRASLSGSMSVHDSSPLIFYFNGTRKGVALVGNVYGYFLAGGYNIKDVGYIVHEIWFRDNKTLVRPKDFGIAEPSFYSLPIEEKLTLVKELPDPYTKNYVLGFPNPDCGGEAIKDIRGFTIARPFR